MQDSHLSSNSGCIVFRQVVERVVTGRRLARLHEQPLAPEELLTWLGHAARPDPAYLQALREWGAQAHETMLTVRLLHTLLPQSGVSHQTPVAMFCSASRLNISSCLTSVRAPLSAAWSGGPFLVTADCFDLLLVTVSFRQVLFVGHVGCHCGQVTINLFGLYR